MQVSGTSVYTYRLALCAGLFGAKSCAGGVSYWSRPAFRPPGVFSEKRHQNTRRSRVAAPADLEPPKGLGLGLGFGLRLGSGWSGPTCRVEIDHIRPAQSFVPTSPAHRASLLSQGRNNSSSLPVETRPRKKKGESLTPQEQEHHAHFLGGD